MANVTNTKVYILFGPKLVAGYPKSRPHKNITSVNETGKFLKLFFDLPFLNRAEVIDCFINDLMAVRPTDDVRIVPFMDYVCDGYISSEARFPPIVHGLNYS